MIVEDQEPVLAFLARPEAFGAAPGTEVTRIDTHISAVFVCGDRVLKLKRAVRYSYLDFSTAEQRRHYCEAEVRVNSRTAPDLYTGVRAVTRRPDGTLALDGDGEAVDWVVDMVRFDEDQLFDRLARRDALDREVMWDLADAVAEFHMAAEPKPEAGGAEGLRGVVEGNAQAFADCPAGLLDDAAATALDAASRDWLERLAPVLEERREAGRVRHCHGDLHLRNVVLLDGRPTLFDAIEFCDAFADIDTFFDLAFLLMDLDHRDMGRHACILMNGYLDITGDESGLAALPLFLSLRAAIRAHVDAAAADTVEDPAARDEAAAEARAYLDQARAYLTPAEPRLVAVGGLSGSGKSRMGRELAPHLAAPGARVLRTDVLRKRLLGKHPLERLDESGYRPEVTRQTYDALYARVRETLAAGHPVVADAVFARPEERDAIARVAAEAGVPFTGLWLEAPAEVMKQRVAKRKANASDADARVVEMQLDYDLGRLDWSRVDSSGRRRDTLRRGLEIIGLEGD